jgi:pyrroline-5-carboxylate reductase
MAASERRFGFIGGGAMAEALAGGLLASGIEARHVRASDPDPARRKHLEEQLGVATTAENPEVVAQADVVVLAVKPTAMPQVLAGLAGAAGVDALQPLWISIAAGISIASLEEGLPEAARIVRAMPNTPALVGEGATAICANRAARADDHAAARALFECVGLCWEAPREELLDAVTGLSGSGPAYVFVFLEALAEAGVREGLPREAAAQLAAQTVFGAAKLAMESGRHPAQLKDQVASPGGTTIAGLERLEAGAFRAALYDAVAAATRRSKELGGG